MCVGPAGVHRELSSVPEVVGHSHQACGGGGGVVQESGEQQTHDPLRGGTGHRNGNGQDSCFQGKEGLEFSMSSLVEPLLSRQSGSWGVSVT